MLATEDDRVALVLTPGEVAGLERLQAKRLRATLWDGVFALDEPVTCEEHQHAVPAVPAPA